MAGTQSAGFDLVMQFSEEPLRQIFGVAFDTSDLLCTVLDATLNQIPGVEIPCEGFSIAVSLDRPSDITLTAAQTNAVDIQMSHTIGLIDWRIRLVVGIDVDRSASGFDVAMLDLHNRLYHAEAHFGLLPLNTATLQAYLRDTVRTIPLLPVIVDRTTTNEAQIKRLDAKVIDQTGGGENALSYCFTFGAGAGGNLDAFTESFVGAGDTGTLMVGFGWILRQMEPVIEASLGIPADAFVNGRLTRSVVIDADEDVKLTKFDFELVDGFIRTTARIEKSGFCYSASAEVGGQFKIEVVDGELHVDADVTDPDIDLDIPWYCWIGAVFLGGLLGGIIGAVVVPLVLYLVTSTVEGVIDRVADTIVNALNVLNPEVSLPAVGFNLVFQRAFIDDVGIGCRVKVIDTAPVRCAGTVRLRLGEALDLDSGRVGAGRFEGADLEWVRDGRALALRGVCSTRIGNTGSVRFDEVLRFEAYGIQYVRGRSLSVDELGWLQDLGGWLVDLATFIPSLSVFAVRTNERRYAVIQVLDLDDDTLRLRYRTYGTRDPALQIRGGFSCEPLLEAIPVVGRGERAPGIVFEPPKPRLDVAPIVARLPGVVRPPARPEADPPRDPKRDRCEAAAASSLLARLRELRSVERSLGTDSALRIATRSASTVVSAEAALALLDDRRPTMTASVGRWLGEAIVKTRPEGRFDVFVEGHGVPRAVHWWVDGVLLDPAATSTVIDGVTFGHGQEGTRLLLHLELASPLRFELAVGIDDANERRFTTSICVDYRPTCKHVVRAIPHWTHFRQLASVARG